MMKTVFGNGSFRWNGYTDLDFLTQCDEAFYYLRFAWYNSEGNIQEFDYVVKWWDGEDIIFPTAAPEFMATPIVELKDSVKLVDGEGTKTSPYVLGE